MEKLNKNAFLNSKYPVEAFSITKHNDYIALNIIAIDDPIKGNIYTESNQTIVDPELLEGTVIESLVLDTEEYITTEPTVIREKLTKNATAILHCTWGELNIILPILKNGEYCIKTM